MEKPLNNITHLVNAAEAVRGKIYSSILNLPTNTTNKMQPIGNNGAFSMNISEIRKDHKLTLLPSYYIYEYQYKLIVEVLRNTEITNILAKFNSIIKTGIVISNGNRYTLNPQVVEHLKTLQ